MKHFYLLCLLIGSFTSLFGQVLNSREPIVTDRPGKGTDAPVVLEPGMVQLEFGFLYQGDANPDQELILYPNTLVRVGLIERVELRASADIFQEGSQSPTFLSPITLGTKIDLTQSNGFIPKSAVIINVTLAREGPPEVYNSSAEPEIRLLMTHDLTNNMALTTNFGIAWQNQLFGFPDHSYAASLDISISDYVAAFGEFYGFWSQLENSHLFNLGGAILLLPDLQVDISGGVGLSENAPDYFISSGVSVRF